MFRTQECVRYRAAEGFVDLSFNFGLSRGAGEGSAVQQLETLAAMLFADGVLGCDQCLRIESLILQVKGFFRLIAIRTESCGLKFIDIVVK